MPRGLPVDAELLESKHSISLYRYVDGIVVVRRWRGWRHAFAAGFGLIALGLGIAVLLWGNPTVGRPAWVLIVAGVAALYYFAVGLVNCTSITVSPSGLRLWRGPLLVLGYRTRAFPPLRGIDTYTDRVAAISGGAGATHVVRGEFAGGQHAVLDMCNTAEGAEYVRRLLEKGI